MTKVTYLLLNLQRRTRIHKEIFHCMNIGVVSTIGDPISPCPAAHAIISILVSALLASSKVTSKAASFSTLKK